MIAQRACSGLYLIQRFVERTGFLIDQNKVPLRKSAAWRVLPAHAHFDALAGEGAVGERLGEWP